MNITLAVDALSGDNGFLPVLDSSVRAIKNHQHLKILFFGCKKAVTESKIKIPKRLIIKDSNANIAMDRTALSVLRSNEKTSMHLALKAVRNKDADACVSAGNTSVLLALACKIIKLIPKIKRPALLCNLPNINNKKVIMLDVGAIADPKPSQILEFSFLGKSYIKALENKDNPKVGLLNIASENNKGSKLILKTDKLLKKEKFLNYQGFVEAKDIFQTDFDLILTGGFCGNICIKSAESFAHLCFFHLKSLISKYNIDQNLICDLKENISPSSYNGAKLLGLNSTVIKSHGSSDSNDFYNAIIEAIADLQQDTTEKLKKKVKSKNE